MTGAELAEWVRGVKEQGAVKVNVLRVPKAGMKGDLFFTAEPKEDVNRWLERMKEDCKTRRLKVAWYAVVAFDKNDDKLASDRVSISRDEETEGPSADVEPGVMLARDTQNWALAIIDRMLTQHEAMGRVTDRLSESLVKSHDQGEAMLGRMHEVFSLQFERESEVRASEERRELGKNLLAEVGPILGAVATKWTGAEGASVKPLLDSLVRDPARFEKLIALLTPEEVALIEAALEANRPRQKKTEKTTQPNGAKT